MGIMDDLKTVQSNMGRRIKKNPVAVLTSLGRKKLESPGVPEYTWQVLNHLNEEGPCNTRNIADSTGIPADRIKSVLKSLEADGFITRRDPGSEG